jgi:hypothetical protein
MRWRQVHAGNVIETVNTADVKIVLTIRISVVKAAGRGDVAAPIAKVATPPLASGSAFVGAN